MRDTEAPTVSVIMPAYNAASCIGAAISSVLLQTLADWELIVVDDGSTDGTIERIRTFAAADARIRLVGNPGNLGVAMARNRGLEMARGRYVAFLDSDDSWMPGKLAAQVAFMDRTGLAVSYGAYRRIDEHGSVLADVNPPAEVDYRAMLRSNFIGNLTGIYRRAALADLRFQAVGHEDYLFWLNALRQVGMARATPFGGPLALYRVAEGSISGNKLRAMAWQWIIYRKHLGLSPLSSAWFFLNYIFIALAKRWR